MEINEEFLLECINYLYKYNFSELIDYKIKGDIIYANVLPEEEKMGYFLGKKSVDLDIEEYINYIRIKKLNKLSDIIRT
jgi:hypothetical protein